MEGAPGTLYEGEKFQLLFKFSSRYPFDSPQVMFTGENIPVHPHVYSNGHICLSILTEDWSPALSVQSVCLSIISMLSSCKEKRRPPDNSFYVRTCNKNPKKTKWWYHDIKLNTHQLSLTLPHENLQVSKSQDPKSKERRCNMRNNHSWLSQWPALSCQSGCSTKPRILMLNSDTAVHTPGWVTDNYCTLRIIRNTCTSCAVSMQA
ncbi:ubiquitin-conjugating enzyme E2 W isoform X2 [Narcine bancroftii]